MNENNRKRFFEILGIEDDGRREPMMTRDEFYKFSEEKYIVRNQELFPKGKEFVIIYFEFSAYTDDTYSYCEETNTIYCDSFYIGD